MIEHSGMMPNKICDMTEFSKMKAMEMTRMLILFLIPMMIVILMMIVSRQESMFSFM